MSAFPFDVPVVDYMRFQLGAGRGCVTLLFGSKPDTKTYDIMRKMMEFFHEQSKEWDIREGTVEPCRYDR